MSKYVLSFLLLILAGSVMAQKKKSIVNLIQSESSSVVTINGRQVIKVYKGVFKQDFSTLRSDSAYFYPNENAFDAFRNVNINQGDTLNIFSDKLNYNGNTKLAILTDNVKMVDRDATLTTNYLTYNTATRIGTYTSGGKLVNKDNVLTSKNGYYFAKSRDSYFRYDVVLTTIDAIIKTDTLRYNTGTRISYFYGPTNIYGKKDKDTLYTENGLYNTVTEQAFFGKKNLYKQGTKSLKGDSLFYDRLKGYGRAVKNITFNDNEQKITLKGDLGTYFKADERTVVTENAYMVLITEQKDSTQTDSAAAKAPPVLAKNAKDAIKNKLKDGPNTKDITNMTKLAKDLKPGTMVSKTDSTRIDSAAKALIKQNKNIKPGDAIGQLTELSKIADNIKAKGTIGKADSVKIDSMAKKLGVQTKNIKPGDADKKLTNMAKLAADIKPKKGAKPIAAPVDTNKQGEKVKRDSIFMTADTLETQIMTFKNLKIYQEKQRLLHFRDTSEAGLKRAVLNQKLKGMPTAYLRVPKDTTYLHRDFFGKPKVDSTQIKKDLLNVKRKARQDSVRAVNMKKDPVFATREFDVKDTARIRILIAHHHAKIFKSDLQGKADSIFYSNADSTIRCYVKPMFWTQGSQLSGDTVYLQMRNKKLDNIELFPNAFVVNIEKDDSLHFNQSSGRKMRGFFKNDKLHQLYIAVNAESIYFKRDSGKIAGMQRSLSSRIHVVFKNGETKEVTFVTKPENRYIPIAKVTEEDKLLKGFIWKPKDRPASKEAIIPTRHKKTPTSKSPPPKVKVDSLTQAKIDNLKGRILKLSKDSTKTDSVKKLQLNLQRLTDSISKAAAIVKSPPPKTKADSLNQAKVDNLKGKILKLSKDPAKADSVKKLQMVLKTLTDSISKAEAKPAAAATIKGKQPVINAGKDTSNNKAGAGNLPAIKVGKDTTGKVNITPEVIKAVKDTTSKSGGVPTPLKAVKDTTIVLPKKPGS
ncbi:OstA-like protein [Mucilaginibacter lappiensis]|uniref:Lipopolysaccharide export system protein LptA n=1 Tax=Mucilaginibacter lappiensis TaxID=354630 RepID=A0ABR6PEZ0_9SPHI|nr:OstA-like protein [Mucilaginibacter lappiensis]MBB6108261.1 lipopolysaccharide export system protein LptA [Mucilaginibacter lappiensis]SIQ45083.1 OstA-like protein [Mucilaginibacter lappiensis]